MAKEYFEDFQKQRAENLARHKRQVEEHIPESVGQASPRDVKRLLDWVGGAQDSGEEDPDLAAMWRLTLEAIYRKEYDVDHILDKVRQLRGPEAKALLAMDAEWSQYDSLDEYTVNVLLGHGLIEKYQANKDRRRGVVFRRAFQFIVASGLLWAFQQYVSLTVQFARSPEQERFFKIVNAVMLFFPVMLGAMAVFWGIFVWREMERNSGALRPTGLGKRIIDLSKKYQPRSV